jgi:hypothetical protein
MSPKWKRRHLGQDVEDVAGSGCHSVKLWSHADNAASRLPVPRGGHTKMVPSSAVIPSSVAMRQKLRLMNPATNAETVVRTQFPVTELPM